MDQYRALLLLALELVRELMLTCRDPMHFEQEVWFLENLAAIDKEAALQRTTVSADDPDKGIPTKRSI